ILASADADKTAREEAREHALTGDKHVHGLFSFQLIEALQGAAKDAPGRVSRGALIGHLARAFPSTSKHRPELAIDAGANMHNIFLAGSAEGQRFLEAQLHSVRTLLQDETPRSLIRAIRDLNDLDHRGLWNDEARSLVDEIDRCATPVGQEI